MLEPRLLGLIPDPTKGDELLAAKAEKPPLLRAAEDPEEEGTELKGDDLELNEENVGCVRAGASWAGFAADVWGVDWSAEVESLLVWDAGAVPGMDSAADASDTAAEVVCEDWISFVLNWSTFLRM